MLGIVGKGFTTGDSIVFLLSEKDLTKEQIYLFSNLSTSAVQICLEFQKDINLQCGQSN